LEGKDTHKKKRGGLGGGWSDQKKVGRNFLRNGLEILEMDNELGGGTGIGNKGGVVPC